MRMLLTVPLYLLLCICVRVMLSALEILLHMPIRPCLFSCGVTTGLCLSEFVCFITTQINVDQSNRLCNLESFLIVYVRSVPLQARVMGRPVGRLMLFIFMVCGQLVTLSSSSPSP